mmetsp:Transcript_71364/g.184004  ORF Transcript_71364/g.184004 Transcript_71364/m.184004 type:complete len:211 (-) Transcript_71364:730-1362(-)
MPAMFTNPVPFRLTLPSLSPWRSSICGFFRGSASSSSSATANLVAVRFMLIVLSPLSSAMTTRLAFGESGSAAHSSASSSSSATANLVAVRFMLIVLSPLSSAMTTRLAFGESGSAAHSSASSSFSATTNPVAVRFMLIVLSPLSFAMTTRLAFGESGSATGAGALPMCSYFTSSSCTVLNLTPPFLVPGAALRVSNVDSLAAVHNFLFM